MTSPVTLDILAATATTGHWCDIHHLPHTIHADVVAITEDGVSTIGHVACCDN